MSSIRRRVGITIAVLGLFAGSLIGGAQPASAYNRCWFTVPGDQSWASGYCPSLQPGSPSEFRVYTYECNLPNGGGSCDSVPTYGSWAPLDSTSTVNAYPRYVNVARLYIEYRAFEPV